MVQYTKGDVKFVGQVVAIRGDEVTVIFLKRVPGSQTFCLYSQMPRIQGPESIKSKMRDTE